MPDQVTTGAELKFVVRVGDAEERFATRDEALSAARERSRDFRGPVTVDNEIERSSYRYVGGELAQFVMETRR